MVNDNLLARIPNFIGLIGVILSVRELNRYRTAAVPNKRRKWWTLGGPMLSFVLLFGGSR